MDTCRAESFSHSRSEGQKFYPREESPVAAEISLHLRGAEDHPRGLRIVSTRLEKWVRGPSPPPSGKTFRVKHMHRFRLKEAKIVEHFAVRDDLGMFKQLGHLGTFSR